MANEAVTVEALTLNTASADLLAVAGGTVEVDANNTAVVSDCSAGEKLLFVFYENGGGAAVATFTAGDYPPAATQALGDLAIAVPASDCVAVAVEIGRFLQSDGSVEIVITGQNVHVTALRLPKGS